MADDKDELYFEGSGKGKVQWGYLIVKAMDRCNAAACNPLSLDERLKDAFFCSVLGLQATIAKYIDKDFEDEKKKIMTRSNPTDRLTTLEEYFEFWGLCSKLIDKAGLLPDEDKAMWDEYEDTESGFFKPSKKADKQQGA